MTERVLITGGAGFIGSHLCDRLLAGGYRVRVLDALLAQVHPHQRPEYLDPAVELQKGDVRDAAAVRAALEGVGVLVHFAAAVGVGQSMYEIGHYCSINVMGTASVLEVLVKDRPRLRRILVASSMSIYGEGRYQCPGCGPVDPLPRPAAQLAAGDWSMRCPSCGSAVTAIPTPESKPLSPRSVYATNKRDQEELVLTVARSLGLSAIALRFFNAYGPRQALSNPYTGVAAIFANALLSGRRPLIFEDGRQIRDFIHVSDVVEACALALQKDEVADEALNVGTGKPTSLLQLLDLLRAEVPGAAEIEPEILGRFREGDIRACFADVSRARALLGFEPRISISDGARELAGWARDQAIRDRSGEAFEQLRRFGLVR